MIPQKYLLRIVSCCAVLGLGGVWAITLDFVDIDTPSLADRFSEVHFVAAGNDFGGALFRLNTQSLQDPVTVSFGSEELSCHKQIKGLYYNSQRGQRLRPLDGDTLQGLQASYSGYADLVLDGAWYTSCDTLNPYSVFGQITINNGGDESYLIAGVTFSYPNNDYQLGFKDSLQLFNNQKPIGYLYDSVGGIGFVGGLLSGHDDVLADIALGSGVQDIFRASGDNIYASGLDYLYLLQLPSSGSVLEAQRSLGIVGTVGLTPSLTLEQKQALLGNIEDSVSVFSIDSITPVDLYNRLRNRMQTLCRGRVFNSALNDGDTILCIQYPYYQSSERIIIDLSNQSLYAGKTLFVRNTDVVLQGAMTDTSAPLNLFVDKGNVYIDADDTDMIPFGGSGYPSIGTGVTQGLLIAGNILIHGLLLGGDGISIDALQHRLYLHGKLVSLNTPDAPDVLRRNYIAAIFASSNYAPFISLENLSARRCRSNGIASDGADCGTFADDFSYNTLVLIDRYIPSLLLN